MSAHPAELEPLTLSIQSAARYLDVPPETFRSWLKRGLFHRLRIGRRTLVLKRELDEFIRKQEEAAP